MKYLRCGQVCVNGCDYVAKGRTDGEIIRNIFYHADRRHHDILNDMTDGCREKIVSIMHASIQTE